MEYERSNRVFGYVRPLKPEMKVRELGVFNSVYCGLCHSLKKRYGFPARLMLSYDITFLAAVRLSQADICSGFCKKRCIAHPFKKRDSCAVTEDTVFCADVSAILFYYKLKDTIKDSGFFKKTACLLLLPYVAFIHKKAEKNAPEVEKAAREYALEQNLVERKNSGIIDEAADPTGKMLAAIMKMGAKDSAERRIFSRFGYFLGRWIYFIDAADDITKDIGLKCYNPFVNAYGLNDGSDFKDHVKDVERLLNVCINEMCAAWELLPKGRFYTIVANILYLGLPKMQKNVLSGRNKTKKVPQI